MKLNKTKKRSYYRQYQEIVRKKRKKYLQTVLSISISSLGVGGLDRIRLLARTSAKNAQVKKILTHQQKTVQVAFVTAIPIIATARPISLKKQLQHDENILLCMSRPALYRFELVTRTPRVVWLSGMVELVDMSGMCDKSQVTV